MQQAVGLIISEDSGAKDSVPLEEISNTRTNQLENASVEGVGVKLSREAHLLMGGVTEGTFESAADGLTTERVGRTLLNVGLGAALAIAMKRPDMLGNLARGAGTVGALNFAADMTSSQRRDLVGQAIGDTWTSADNFDRNYATVKNNLGPVGFDLLLGVGSGALGAGFATKFSRTISPLAELPSTIQNQPETFLPAEKNGLSMNVEKSSLPIKAPDEPLNIFSRSDEPLGRALSNFAHTPFELDGVKYASVEAFYQGLKYLDPVKRAEMAPLYGNYAKSAASKAGKLTENYVYGRKNHAGFARASRLNRKSSFSQIDPKS